MHSADDLKKQLTFVLGALSPTYIISQGWDGVLKDFLSRGTRHELQQLLPREYLLAPTISSTAHSASSGSSPNTDCDLAFGSVENPSTAPASEALRNVVPMPTTMSSYGVNGSFCASSALAQRPISFSSARNYTCAHDFTPDPRPKTKSRKRVSNKVFRAVHAMREAKKHETTYYDSIWLGLQNISDGQDVEEVALNRYGRIQALQSRNNARGDMFKYAQRFSLLLGAQELQVIEKTLPSEACSRGVTLRSVAISRLAEYLQVEKRQILDENKRRSHYVSVCELFGPGALLLLGDSEGVLSLWERDMNTEDIESLYEYVTCHLRDWMADCKKLNEKAVALVAEGLRACGWDGRSHRDTLFMKSLAGYFDLERLPSMATSEALPRKRKSTDKEASSKRHHQDMFQNIIPDGGPTSPHVELNNRSMDQFGGSQSQSSVVNFGTTLDWDFSVNLSLDWDQFIEDQITESMNV